MIMTTEFNDQLARFAESDPTQMHERSQKSRITESWGISPSRPRASGAAICRSGATIEGA